MLSESTIQVFIPEDVLLKIKYLCQIIPQDEWSGILLYKVEGSIKDPKNCKLILKDIIPMDKGSKTYTEYTFNEKFGEVVDDKMIDYFNANMHAMDEDWKIGHIHSHNSMDVFFSGTDTEELHENASSHNFYLSLIVNNWMDFTAKVASKITAKNSMKVVYTALDENGKEYEVSSEPLDVMTEKIIEFDCEIDHPSQDIKILDPLFIKTASSIIEKKEKVKTLPGKSTFTKGKHKNGKHKKDQVFSQFGGRGSYGHSDGIEEYLAGQFDFFSEEEEEEPEGEVFANFISFLVLGYEEDHIEDVIESLANIKDYKDSVDLRLEVVERFPTAFEKFFPDSQDKEFLALADYSIDFLREHQELCLSHLVPVVEILEVLIDKFKRYGTKAI